MFLVVEQKYVFFFFYERANNGPVAGTKIDKKKRKIDYY